MEAPRDTASEGDLKHHLARWWPGRGQTSSGVEGPVDVQQPASQPAGQLSRVRSRRLFLASSVMTDSYRKGAMASGAVSRLPRRDGRDSPDPCRATSAPPRVMTVTLFFPHLGPGWFRRRYVQRAASGEIHGKRWNSHCALKWLLVPCAACFPCR